MRIQWAAGAAIAGVLVCSTVLGFEPTREASGQRLERLSEMELKPFPPEAWGDLSEWSGQAIGPEQTAGKVVLIVTWASWYKPSLTGLSLASRLYDKHASEGLVVVGVHHPKGFDGAAAVASERHVAFPWAHDAEGRFRQRLLVDNDPDFYLIDRAGLLRYADVKTGSVEQAVVELLAQSAEQSASIPELIEQGRKAVQEQARRTGGIAQGADLTKLPEIPFVMPDEAVFASQDWWEPPKDTRNRSRDDNGLGQAITLPSEGWYPDAPTRKGRARVLYFWNPKPRFAQTYSVIGDMDTIQRAYARDVDVIGVLTPMQDRSRRRDDDDEQLDYAKAMRGFIRTHTIDHRLLADPNGQLFSSVFNRRSGNRRGQQTFGAVLSSDGKLRWFGDLRSSSFAGALHTVLRVDPGLQARRRAEQGYIEGRN